MIEIKRTVDVEEMRKILSQPRAIEKAVTLDPEKFLAAVKHFPTTGGTLYDTGEPIAAGGIITYSKPYGFVFLIASRDLKPYKNELMAEVETQLKDAQAAGMVLRTTVSAGVEVAERFAKKVGFIKTPQGYWELK